MKCLSVYPPALVLQATRFGNIVDARITYTLGSGEVRKLHLQGNGCVYLF